MRPFALIHHPFFEDRPVHGRQLEAGDVVHGTDLYALERGWVPCGNMDGLPLITGEIVVRPAVTSSPPVRFSSAQKDALARAAHHANVKDARLLWAALRAIDPGHEDLVHADLQAREHGYARVEDPHPTLPIADELVLPGDRMRSP